MTISSLAAAKRICERSGWSITNLQLQKILYLAQMAYMGKHNGRPLIEGNFEAWNYGPVMPDVYAEFSHFGRKPIQNTMKDHCNIDDNCPEAGLLDYYTDLLLKYTAPQLVSITHWDEGAWARNYEPGVKGIIIPPEHIMDEYYARVRT